MNHIHVNNINHLIYLIAKSVIIDVQHTAFQKLYLMYWKPLTRYASKIISDAMEAEDFVQETFSELWLCRNQLFLNEISNKETLDKWLLLKVRRLTTNFKKKRLRIIHFNDEKYKEAIQSQTVMEDGQEQELERKEYHEKMDQIINDLPREMRIVYNNKIKKGYTLLQISSEMGISVTQVREYFEKAKIIIEEKMMLTYRVRRFLTETMIEKA